MNVGVYVSSLGNNDLLKSASDGVNKVILENLVDDACIFYDNVGYMPFEFNCGMFNSSDLWNFSGKLITTSLSTAISSLRIVNNIDIYYYYGWDDSQLNTLSIIQLLKSGVRFIALSDTFAKDFYRKTGHRTICTSNDWYVVIKHLRDTQQ